MRRAKAQGELPSKGKKAERGSAGGKQVTLLRRERTFQVHESRSRATGARRIEEPAYGLATRGQAGEQANCWRGRARREPWRLLEGGTL